MRLSSKKKIALVLSGGGIKAAAFHIGVCMALREKGFRFAGGSPDRVRLDFESDRMTIKTYVGSSAGAAISTFLAAGHSVETIVDAFTRGAGYGLYWRSKRNVPQLKPINYRDIFALNLQAGLPSSWVSQWLKKKPVISGGFEVLLKRGFKMNGIFSTQNLEKYFRNYALEANKFSDLGVELYIVATQLNHSRKVVFGAFEETTKNNNVKYANYASVSESVAASAALPPFFAPFGIQNHKGKKIQFFDGEIRDTLSTHVAADHGADLVISSYSIQPYHYHKEVGSLHEYGIPIIANQALYQVVQQKIATHIQHQKDIKNMINAVNGYLKEAEIAEEHREKLMDILVSRTRFKPNVDYIYIHPSPHDYEMFFYDHFSLNPKILTQIVKIGFKSAMHSLRTHNL